MVLVLLNYIHRVDSDEQLIINASAMSV